MQAAVAVIGGSGVGSLLASWGGPVVHVPTPFGMMRARRTALEERNCYVIERHGAGHKTAPHLVNYRALAAGAQALGVGVCFSSAAVGSLTRRLEPGAFVVCSDFVDASGRQVTRYQRTVHHSPMSPGFDERAQAALFAACAAAGVHAEEGVYVGVDGPRYETPAEIRHLAKLGDVVGMTAASEAIAFREAGIPYGCLALVTNRGAGLSERPPDHQEVLLAMRELGATAAAVLRAAAQGGLRP